jgi:hypothetical protein
MMDINLLKEIDCLKFELLKHEKTEKVMRERINLLEKKVEKIRLLVEGN